MVNSAQPHQPLQLPSRCCSSSCVDRREKLPHLPCKSREEIQLPRLDFLGWQAIFFTLHERKLGGGLLHVPSSATFAHVCFRTPSDCGVSSPKAAQPGSMRSKRPQSALTPAFLIRTKPKLLFAWIMYHVCVYAAVVPNVLFLYQITRGCKAQNP